MTLRRLKFTIEIIVNENDEPNAEELRNDILDAWGFPTRIEEEPDLLKVALIEREMLP
jgi:hypothetical protein